MKISLHKMFRNIFRNMKIFKKLLLSYLVIFLLPVSFTVFFLVPKVSEETLNQSMTINQISFEQLKDNMTYQFINYINLLDNVAQETELAKYLISRELDYEDYGRKFFKYYRLTSLYENKYIETSLSNIKIKVYSDNNAILYGNQFLYKINDDTREEEWFQRSMEARGLTVISKAFLDENNKYNISISKRIILGEASEGNNLVRIIIPLTLLENYIEKEGQNKDIYIIDHQGNIIISSIKDSVGSNITQTQYASVLHSSLQDVAQVNISKRKDNIIMQGMLGTKAPLDEYKIIYGISPSDILSKTNEIVRYSIIILTFNIVAAFFFIMAFSRTITSRLRLLVTSMTKIKGDNFDLCIDLENEDKDEIGELSRNFKSLIQRISTLINEVYLQKMSFQELELKQRETEFLALQSQINPHFLFNTIESIRMKALTNKDVEISEILESFGKMLRRSFDWSSRFVTLEQELSLVENYIKIQKFRYNDRFDYTLNIKSDVLDCQIPKFIVQPIVENAISHGLEMKKNGGILNITVYEEEVNIKIVIEDNGLGITEERIKEVSNAMAKADVISSYTSIGIKNVYQRISLIYGIEDGIVLSSNPGVGTKVIITIPRKARKDDLHV